LIYNKATIGFEIIKEPSLKPKPLKKFNIGYFDVVWQSVLKIKRKSNCDFLKVLRV
jgi:hypothetical protein